MSQKISCQNFAVFLPFFCELLTEMSSVVLSVFFRTLSAQYFPPKDSLDRSR